MQMQRRTRSDRTSSRKVPLPETWQRWDQGQVAHGRRSTPALSHELHPLKARASHAVEGMRVLSLPMLVRFTSLLDTKNSIERH